jgi:hypothetical protein
MQVMPDKPVAMLCAEWQNCTTFPSLLTKAMRASKKSGHMPCTGTAVIHGTNPGHKHKAIINPSLQSSNTRLV